MIATPLSSPPIMNLNNILNKPGDQPPPRRPRLSSSYSKESQSPADYRQGSVSVTTPISPYAPSSAHPGTPHGYPNPPNSALSATPSSTTSQGAFHPPSAATPTTYQPATPLQSGPPPSLHSQPSSQIFQPHPPMYPPPPQPQQEDPYRQQSPSRLDQSQFRREHSQSVSPRTVHSRPSFQSQSLQSSEQPQAQQYQTQPPPPPIPVKRQESSAVTDREPSVPASSVKEEPSVATPSRWSEPRVESPAKGTPTANINNKRPLPDDSSPTTSAAPVPFAATAPTQVKQEPQQKKRRVGEIPIWAQPAKNLKPLPKYTLNGAPAPAPVAAAAPPPIAVARTTTPPTMGQPQPKTQPNFGSSGPLGPFEETFRGDFVPQEELTKQVCDFLFRDVVLKQDLPTGEAGGGAPVQGQLEIEAKIGTIIDKRTDERLSLPISTETILRPNYPVAFESMMTETQHKSYNALLNEALKSSMGPPATAQRDADPKPRIKMSYRHIYEVDTFYELPDEELSNLPLALQKLVRQTPQHKPTLRVTRDKKTNEVKAKIVKTRISDMHVYSPSTSFDWRISVNFEADWDGDLDALIKSVGESNTKGHPDRHKDRMSYSHLFCKIDLTQVKGQSNKGPTTTHELEVELESKMVREQGKLVLAGSDNQYQELVKGFVDNVRILIRGVQ